MSKTKTITVREHDKITGLDEDEKADLKKFALANQIDRQGNYRPVLVLRNDQLCAQNYVGLIETRKGTVLEILPKINLAENDEEQSKKIFFKMLRTWRGTNPAQFNDSNIKDARHFNMLEIFVWLFLNNLILLTQRGLAHHYEEIEDNISCLRGRILFPQHIRNNLTNRARFYVSYDEFTTNRPVNRLIQSTIQKLTRSVTQPRNRQLLHQLSICFSNVPQSRHPKNDWYRHQLDRSMQHYEAVMQWVGLFLFNHGLTTFVGKHVNQALLFPMEDVFEDFVTHCFRRYQKKYLVQAQGPRKRLAERLDGSHQERQMRPDISLMSSSEEVKFILDTKWKHIAKHDIGSTDMYQLYSYGKGYGCKIVALIYPKTSNFNSRLDYRFHDGLQLFCFPFDVNDPQESTKEVLGDLQE